MGTRRLTMYDVAERANVSIATVSFAFSRPDQISAATRDRVLEIAREIGYMPSAAARGLAKGRTGTLGLHSFDLVLERPQESGLVEPDEHPRVSYSPGRTYIPWTETADTPSADPRAFPLYVDEVQRGFELECRAQHRPVMLSSGSDTATAVAESAGFVDGLAIFPSLSASASLTQVSLKMPIVLFSTPPADDSHHRVQADNAGGMRDLINHLVLTHQITDLGFVGAIHISDFQQRFEGFRDALSSLDIVAPDRPFDDTELGTGRGFTAVLNAIRSRTLPRALVCANDQLALTLIDLLAAEGLSVPGDIIVTGFDGILAGRLSTPTLTTVRQPMEAMGRAAAQLLISSTTLGVTEPSILHLQTQLVVRRSCGCTAP